MNSVLRRRQQQQQQQDIKERYVRGPNDQIELEGSDSDSDGDGDSDYNTNNGDDRSFPDIPCGSNHHPYGYNIDSTHAIGQQVEYSNSNPSSYNPMMTMDLQSITTAYREGDGCSFGYFSGHTRQVRSIETQAIEQQTLATRNMNAVSDLLVRARNPDGELKGLSLNDAQQLLIIRAICPVYYESDRQYGNYQHYRYIQNDQVFYLTVYDLIVRYGIYSHLLISFDESYY